jgi:hypothetical protein
VINLNKVSKVVRVAFADCIVFHFPEILNAYSKNIPLVFIGTSFIGMVSSKFKVAIFLAVAGILFSSVYQQVISFKVSVER